MHVITECPRCKSDFMYHTTDRFLLRQTTIIDEVGNNEVIDIMICQDCHEKENNSKMKKGKVVKKDNCFYVRTVAEGDHSDEIELVYYPVSLTESNRKNIVEGSNVEFSIEILDYTEVDGLGQSHFLWALIK